MTYRLHPEAEAEHLDAVAYYETWNAGLGARYLAEFDQILKRVCASPHRYRIDRHPDIRRVRMERFPFTIFYRETKGRIEVLAVAHHRRRPTYWTTCLRTWLNQDNQKT